tara:strand:- start:53 stop:352 length:300 start_codon:yes stop_codon:yes gene_type:complete
MAGVDTYYEYLKRQHYLATHMELTDVNVNNVLNEIRPYIEADGGYLEFVSIDYLEEGPVVFVKLLGACESCAMSSMTLKQGIETHLQNKWPEIKQVIQI